MTGADIQLAQDADFRAVGRLHAQSWQTAYGSVFPEERLLGDIGLALQERWTEYRPAESDLVLSLRPPTTRRSCLGSVPSGASPIHSSTIFTSRRVFGVRVLERRFCAQRYRTYCLGNSERSV